MPGDASTDSQSINLRQLLMTLGGSMIDVLAAPSGLDAAVRDVVILDPDDRCDVTQGDVVLLIGARGRAAVPAMRAAGRQGAAAVAVKVADDENTLILRQTAADAGTALLAVATDARWEQVEALTRGVIGSTRLAADTDGGSVLGDLFSVAQTIADLTGGVVSIEDTGSRVLAYSRSSDDVDELRRLSILGRQGPESYLTMLREWGVYERIHSGEHVVCIDEREDLGIRRRLVVGINAGSRPLGTIWVQEGATPLADDAEQVLVGAARAAAPHLIRQLNEPTATLRLRERLLAGLLEGRVDAESVAGQMGADSDRPAAVVAFTLGEEDPNSPVVRSELQLRLTELVSLVSVHAAAYRRSALVTQLGARTYVLLPNLVSGGTTSPAIRALARDIVAAARRHLGLTVRASIGSTVDRVDLAPSSRREADRVLHATARDLNVDVATIDDVRSLVLLSETVAMLAATPSLRDPRMTVLRDQDAEHGSELISSMRAYLDAFGDVRAAADALHVHPNTVRYRLRRVEAISGIDLSDPVQRLFTQLQLRLPTEDW